MLDEKEEIILKYIVSECGDDYKVIYKDDFEDFFITKFGKKKIRFEQILSHLKNLHYIDIKYSDDEKYCLCATEQSKTLFEEENTEKIKIKKIKKNVIFLVLLIFVFAFFGAFLGTIICNIIF